uniref:Phosphoinositide 3-kinase regulatory subunit 5 n=1 Tax=Neogobius melanostomus TaxID=47308 RepID=A0A8C6TC45_9GOBI
MDQPQQTEQSSCTEDRIEHVLERCLCDLGLDTPDKQLWNAGLCINRWCLEELVKRDPQNFLILLNKILRKTEEVLLRCEYELVVPLTLLLSSALLKAPHVPADCGLLQEAYSLFHRFLSWPEPCSSACRRLLRSLQHEMRAPGISFQRLMRTEQGLPSVSHRSKTMTVLLVSPEEDTPPEVQCVSHQLSVPPSCSRDIHITLILQALQAALGATDRSALHAALLVKHNTFIVFHACYSISHCNHSCNYSFGVDSDFSEEPGQHKSGEHRKKPKKKSKSLRGVERFSLLFKTPRSPMLCRRAQSMSCRTDLPRNKPHHDPCRQSQSSASSPMKHLCARKRPILSCDLTEEPEEVTQLRVVVFGGDKELGRLARAYSDLQRRDSKQLAKRSKLHFYYIYYLSKFFFSFIKDLFPDSTSNVAHMLGTVDPWYERNVLSLLSLSSDILCQVIYLIFILRPSLLTEMVLYYCRHAQQSVLVQLYQAELTLSGGERRVEVFVQSLELGHSAGTRAVKAMGAVSKRLGVDDEQEAAPLTLNIAYNKVAISGRSQWIELQKVCTSINLFKACRKHKQLESLQLMMAEVLKRQCSKSKKFCISEVKVDRAHVHAGSEGTTFAVCLDQDEKKFIQSVVRCEVSLCSKPGSSSDWRTYGTKPGQVQPLHPSYCSLLCLPLRSFCPSQH